MCAPPISIVNQAGAICTCGTLWQGVMLPIPVATTRCSMHASIKAPGIPMPASAVGVEALVNQ